MRHTQALRQGSAERHEWGRRMFIEEKDNAIAFKVFVQPKSARNMIIGCHGDALKIKLTAPPVDGAANKMCIKFFSKILGISKSSIEIQSGHASRTKILRIPLGQDSGDRMERERIRDLLNRISTL